LLISQSAHSHSRFSRSPRPAACDNLNESMRRLFPAVLGASHLLAASADDVTCYKLDGTSRTVDGTKVCNSLDGAVSMCCASSDTCLNNGLCKTAGDSVSYWRDMCSISSWPEVGCLKTCTVCRLVYFCFHLV
jgi:hypothetical protein